MMRPLDTGKFWDGTPPAPPVDARSADTHNHDSTGQNSAAGHRPPHHAFAAASRSASHEPANRTNKRLDLGAASWLAVGFLSGIISWHTVGFWDFVTETVLHENAGAMTTMVAKPGAATIVTGSITPHEAPPVDCVALVQLQPGGRTAAQPCTSAARPLRDAGRNPRADRLATSRERLQSANAWTAAAEPTSAPAEAQASPTSGDTATAEFDLSLSAPN